MQLLDQSKAAAVLIASGRPKLLAYLKANGIEKLSDRQALAGEIQRAVKDGTLIPAVNDDSKPSLSRLAFSGDEIALRAMLEDDDLPSVEEQSAAVMSATLNGHCACVELLLRAAPLPVVDGVRKHDGCTAVMLAVKSHNQVCLQALLAARADADAINNDGWSALMMACEADQSASVRTLLDAGASPVKGLHNGWAIVLTPLKLACIGGHSDCVELLLNANAALDDDDGSRLDIVEADGSTMLLYAAQRTHHRIPKHDDGHVRTVKLLLAAKAKPDQTRWDGLTPLAYSCMYGDAESARLLLEHHAQPSKRDEAGWPPLLWAAIRGHTACVKLLIDEYAVPADEARPNGCTALMAASLSGSVDCVDALIQSGARIDARTACVGYSTQGLGGRGLSALMLAAKHGHSRCVRRLLDANASTTLLDASGATAMGHATRGGHVACASLLAGDDELLFGGGDGEQTVVVLDEGFLPQAPAASGPLFGPIPRLSHLDSWQESAGGRFSNLVQRGDETTNGQDAAAPSSAEAAAPMTAMPITGGLRSNLQYFVSSSHPHFANLLQLILIEHGFSRSERHDGEWTLMWHAGQIDPHILSRLTRHQFVNKFPHSGCLTTKSQLWSTFERMQKKHGVQAYGFLPTTYNLPAQSEELQAAMDEQAKAEEATGDSNGSSSAWIVKPVAACRGSGISLHWSADGLPDEVSSRRGVASMYVHPPYLVDHRKVDLRLYVLVTSWRPLVCYIHHQGLCRLATEAYSLDELDDTRKHLTNYAINKKSAAKAPSAAAVKAQAPSATSAPSSPKLVPAEAPIGAPPADSSGPKIGLDAFREILSADVGEGAAERAWEGIDDAIVKTLIAAEAPMGQAVSTYIPKDGGKSFQLLGLM